MNNTVAVSALVNGLFINPHDCPILCNCGWRDDATKENWKFCGHYVGHQHINGNMITVSCNCPEVVALDSC